MPPVITESDDILLCKRLFRHGHNGPQNGVSGVVIRRRNGADHEAIDGVPQQILQRGDQLSAVVAGRIFREATVEKQLLEAQTQWPDFRQDIQDL
ncbi:hypothetical protein D3C80_1023130 [compost metagenome]